MIKSFAKVFCPEGENTKENFHTFCGCVFGVSNRENVAIDTNRIKKIGEREVGFMAHDVFISYSSKDKVFADMICERLESENIFCWYAPRDIEPGAEWATSIIKAIDSTSILLLLFSDNSNDSHQVLREVGYAADKGTVVIPFKITKTESHLAESLKYYLNTAEWINGVGNNFEKSVQRLISICKSYLTYGKNKLKKKRKLKITNIIWAVLIILPILFALYVVISDPFDGEANEIPTVYSEYSQELECKIDGISADEFREKFFANLNSADEGHVYTAEFDSEKEYYFIYKDFEKTEYILSFADADNYSAFGDSDFCKVVTENMNTKSDASDEETLFYVKALLLAGYPDNSEEQVDKLLSEMIAANDGGYALNEDNFYVYFETHNEDTYAYGGIINEDLFKA